MAVTEVFIPPLGSEAAQAITVTDTATATVTDILTLTHFTSGTAAASYGVGLLFVGEDAGGNTDNMARISAVWSAATAGSEDSQIQFQVRRAGAALATVFQVNTHSALMLQVGASGLVVGASGSVIMAGTADTYVGVIDTQGMAIRASNVLTLNSRGDVWINCDADNNSTTGVVKIGMNAGTASATALFEVNELSSVVCGSLAALTAGTATDGFLYVPCTDGAAPTGTPTTKTGKAAIAWAPTAKRLWVYDFTNAVWSFVAFT